MTHQVEILVDVNGRVRVCVEGHDISHCVRGVALQMAPGKPAVCQLAITPDSMRVATAAQVTMVAPQPSHPGFAPAAQ